MFLWLMLLICNHVIMLSFLKKNIKWYKVIHYLYCYKYLMKKNNSTFICNNNVKYFALSFKLLLQYVVKIFSLSFPNPPSTVLGRISFPMLLISCKEVCCSLNSYFFSFISFHCFLFLYCIWLTASSSFDSLVFHNFVTVTKRC